MVRGFPPIEKKGCINAAGVDYGDEATCFKTGSGEKKEKLISRKPLHEKATTNNSWSKVSIAVSIRATRVKPSI